LKVVLDIETDGFNPSTIHCIVAKDIDTNVITTWDPGIMYGFKNWSKNVDTFIMHNGLSFDAPVLNRLLGTTIRPSQVLDTLILSQLFNPMREGGHGLKAWGDRFNFPKGDIGSFSKYTEDLRKYCIQDVDITHKLYEHLKKEGRGFSKSSIDLEHQVKVILDQQEKNGFALDIKKAMLLLGQLSDEASQLEKWAIERFEPTKVELKTKTKYIPFNIGSRQQIANRLMAIGWKPKKFTDKGSVIVNEDVLDTIDIPEAKKFSRFFLLQKRVAQIKSWIESFNDKTGRVHGKVMTLKTITGRMAHNSPNMAQIPAVRSPYGKECRECWTVGNIYTHSIVGTDASGLELRCLAHLMNDKQFTDTLLTGDIHTHNMNMAGLTDRDQAKTFIYAFMYGAGPAKIGQIVGGGSKEGKVLIDRFLKSMPSLKRVRDIVTNTAQKHGVIKGIDGRLLRTRSPHSALNTLIQGAGAVVCKLWLVNIMKRTTSSNLDVKLVASVHDEYQFEVVNKDVQAFCKITKYAMKDTEKQLQMRCPLDNEHKVGKTWAETH
jgi:DNA polymerase I-like protein with 3'-5' exonuclease and polymerase domains